MKASYKKSAQDIQDEIFRKMSVQQKIKATSELSMFCLKLNQLNNERSSRKSRKTSY